MLDIETKRRIDNARDILVGKVPDPKSQVEQITLALIYKFMDDMDKQSEEWGGKASFFAGEYKNYSWASIFDPKLSGYDMLNLYYEGLIKMQQNPNLPLLFREIFKNGTLPYRDPETLKSFLKEINRFCYDHSERLGDAYEYLLSVLGSQGDAGQFRTPRHIIDFMVKVLDPKKNETILDPACGTAGFLISSYKHIMEQNTKDSYGDLLTPEEKNRLITNFTGYDISPDMVRISQVNMYLHGFANPKIHEYDTLTSEERWNDTADVILANPPFMTPKGGIRPHKRFSIQANRSEVLFVDYISEHLNNNGRAGIIVPEGIIFQSGNAYKALRKILVENYLYAVVSLPAGVFNPYAGVKTSILFFDKALAKKTNSILFIKVDNDGFNLGAQRREIEGTNLPEALNILEHYKRSILNGQSLSIEYSKIAFTISKEIISKTGDYNLSGGKHKNIQIIDSSSYPVVELNFVCEFIRGLTYNKQDESQFPTSNVVLRANNIDKNTSKLNLSELKYLKNDMFFDNSKKIKRNDILICTASGSKDHLGKVAFINEDNGFYFGGFMGVVRANDKIMDKYLFYSLTSVQYKHYISTLTDGVNINNLRASDLLAFKIPLPPIEVQREIVAEIEGYQKIIDGAKQVIENYKAQISIDNEWQWVELGELFYKVTDNINPKLLEGTVNYIGLENIASNTGKLIGKIRSDYSEIKSTKLVFQPGDILFGKLRPNLNKVYLSFIHGVCSTDFIVLRAKKNINNKFYETFFRNTFFNKKVLKGITGAQLPRISSDYLLSLSIPFPNIDTQNSIASVLQNEQELIDSIENFMHSIEIKIQDKTNNIWKK